MKKSNRRQFLKSIVASGAGLTAGTVIAESERNTQPDDNHRKFSALAPDFIYLNSGTEGSMPASVIATFQDGLEKWASDPTTSYESDPVFGKRQENSRMKVGKFLGVGRNNICLTDNTTMGLSMTLMGLNFRPNDRVVMTNHEHNAIRSPLSVLHARLGLQIEIRSFPSTERLSNMNAGELIETLFPDTPALRGARALCVSHVYPTTGVRLPLRALRQRVDVLGIQYLIVDGAQALGMIDLTAVEDDIGNCDFYACPGHKWLNGPPGTGVLFIRNSDIRPPEFFPTISQRMGNYADCPDGSGDCFPMAKALQVRGCSNVPGFAAMIRAMEFMDTEGGALRFEKHILGLAGDVKEFIRAQAPNAVISPYSDKSLTSGLTAFFPFRWDMPGHVFTDKNSADRLVSELLQKKIQVRSIGFQNTTADNKVSHPVYAVRVSTGYFNSVGQVARFQSALKEILKKF